MSIKDLFWKGGAPDTDATGTGTPARSTSGPRIVPTIGNQAAPGLRRPFPSSTTSVGADEGTAAEIKGLLDQDSKEPGFTEFMTQVNALSKVITDRKQCIAAALAAVSASHPTLTSSQIAKAITERLSTLTHIESGYAEDVEKAERDEAANKTQELNALGERVKELDRDILRLNNERDQAIASSTQVQNALSGVKEKYAASSRRFTSAAGNCREELNKYLTFVTPNGTKNQE
jgi:hypothetical protein